MRSSLLLVHCCLHLGGPPSSQFLTQALQALIRSCAISRSRMQLLQFSDSSSGSDSPFDKIGKVIQGDNSGW